MAEINLLPGGSGKRFSMFRAARILKVTDVMGTIVFGILLALVSGILTVNKLSLDKINENVEALKVQVKTLEATEQQYILVKERLIGLKQIYSDPTLLKDTNGLVALYPALSSNGNISSLDASLGKVDMTVGFESSDKMKAFMQKIAETDFRQVVLDTLSFSPVTGYRGQFKIIR